MVVSSAANSDTFKVTTPSDQEIRMTRLFDAPRHLVFEAMTKPEHVKQWWGSLGEGYSVPVCEIDLRPGGRMALREPASRRARRPSTASIARSPRPSRLVFTEIFEPFPDAESVVTADVHRGERQDAHDGRPCLYPSKDVRDMVIATGMASGAGISYDRLEDLVAELQRS